MRVLLLAGTAEARVLASALQNLPGIAAEASLAGVTRAPLPLGLPCRIGGFGGGAAFAAYLSENRIGAVVDATHPFAAAISARSWQICRDLGIPYLQVLRAAWEAGPGDLWTEIAREEDAAACISRPATVFLATGRQTLDRFANLGHCRLICRQIDPPEGPFPFSDGEFLVGRPPFSVEDESELFTRLGIDWLVVKNSGGTASRSKLDAARRIGLPVLMLARPALLDAPQVSSPGAALDWVRGLRCMNGSS